MGSLASIVTPDPDPSGGHRRPSYGRSASVTASVASGRSRRPSSLHLPVSQTLSASSAMVSPILSVATRAINNNFVEAASAAAVNSGSKSIPYPPLIFPSAEFAPGNHLPKPRGLGPTKGEKNNLAFSSHNKIIIVRFMISFGSLSKGELESEGILQKWGTSSKILT